MAIETKWEDDDKQVIVLIYSGRWELDEFYQSFEKCNQLMDTVGYPVNCIFDMTESAALPNGFMGAIRSLSKKPHRNLGVMAIVGASKLVQIVTDIIAKVYKGTNSRRTYMVQTRADAHHAFRERAPQSTT